MRTARRSAVCLFVLALLLPGLASAQSKLATADAGPVLGDWSVTLDGPMGPLTMTMAMSDNNGVLAAKIDGGELAVGEINDIAKKDNQIVMNFEAEAQGMKLPSTMTLTPEGDKLKVKFDLMNGAFSMDGMASKK